MTLYQDLWVQIPYVDEFPPKYLNELQEDVILDKKVIYTWRGYKEFLCVGLKGMQPIKSSCLETKRVRELYPHLFSKWFHAFGGPKAS